MRRETLARRAVHCITLTLVGIGKGQAWDRNLIILPTLLGLFIFCFDYQQIERLGALVWERSSTTEKAARISNAWVVII